MKRLDPTILIVTAMTFVLLSLTTCNPSEALTVKDVEDGYFENYPKEEGYDDIGDVFNRVFHYAGWFVVKDKDGKDVPGFKGIAELKCVKNIKFEIYFVKHGDNVFINEIYVNGERRFFRPAKLLPCMSDLLGRNTMDDGEFLAAVYADYDCR